MKTKKNYSLGSWITINSEVVVELMCKFNFDWLNIDLEHGNIEITQVQNLIRIISNNNIKPYVRITHRNVDQIKIALDAGAIGLIIPMINSLEDVEDIYSNCHYPPKGNRGMGLVRANMYGLEFDKYLSYFNKNFKLIVQIENIKAIDKIDQILSSKKVNGVFIGPYDLSASMGIPGQFQEKDYLKILQVIKQKCKKHNIPCGIHIIDPDKKELQKRIKENFNIIGFSLDTKMIENSCKKIL